MQVEIGRQRRNDGLAGSLPSAPQSAAWHVANMPNGYLPIFIFLAVAILFPIVCLVAAKLVRPAAPSQTKLEAYECGIKAASDSRGRYTVRFYIVAILFVIFDSAGSEWARLPCSRSSWRWGTSGHTRRVLSSGSRCGILQSQLRPNTAARIPGARQWSGYRPGIPRPDIRRVQAPARGRSPPGTDRDSHSARRPSRGTAVECGWSRPPGVESNSYFTLPPDGGAFSGRIAGRTLSAVAQASPRPSSRAPERQD
jgi:hypothetical protein